ncbi:serine/threonine-protein kinase [Longispora urticae]
MPSDPTRAVHAPAPVFPPLRPGDPSEIGGYRLHALIGSGGMGRVYLAYTPGGRPVALKTVRPEFAEDPDFRARFAHEVANARRVHGLYTAQVLDSGTDADVPWVATAYVPGPSVQQVVRDHGALPTRTVLLLMGGIAEALQAVHRAGVVHRDLKPANVLIAADGPRVIDFGIARAADTVALTGTGLLIGSPAYMAPEQVLNLPVSPAADIFALGALAGFAAGGTPPFSGGPDSAALYRVVHEPPDLHRVPGALRGLLARCLAKHPGDRPTPAEIIDIARSHPEVGGHLRFGDDWLPARVSADVTRRADPPPHLPTVVSPAPTASAPTRVPVPHATARMPAGRWGARPAEPRRADRAVMTSGSGRRRKNSSWKAMILVAAVTAVVGAVGGVVLTDSLDRFLDGPGTTAPPDTLAPLSTRSAPSPGGESAAAPPTAAGYTAVYTGVTLSSPDDSYDFDIGTGTLTPAESTQWALGHTGGEFLAPDASDAYIAGHSQLSVAECSAAVGQRPVTTLAFIDLPPGRAFCVRSRTTRDIVVVRVVEASAGGPVTVSMDYYRAAG